MSTVIITGCSTGFGNLAARRLAGLGHEVFATMRAPDGRNRPAADELRAGPDASRLRVVDLDVTSLESVDAAAALVLDGAGPPDVIVNNAGQMFVGLAELFTPEEFTRQLDVNVVGVHRVCRAFLPAMRQRGSGLIINISSIAGRMALPFFAVYHASKWALEGYSLGLRRELASSGVDLVVVEPGPFTTELFPQSPRPVDADGRGASYPESAHQTFDDMGKSFEELFEDPDTPTDPALVVDRMIELIDMQPGTRPFRSAVGVDFGVTERNAADESRDEALLETMGLEAFATLHAGGVASETQ